MFTSSKVGLRPRKFWNGVWSYWSYDKRKKDKEIKIHPSWWSEDMVPGGHELPHPRVNLQTSNSEGSTDLFDKIYHKPSNVGCFKTLLASNDLSQKKHSDWRKKSLLTIRKINLLHIMMIMTNDPLTEIFEFLRNWTVEPPSRAPYSISVWIRVDQSNILPLKRNL